MNKCKGCGEDISHKRAGALWCTESCRVKQYRNYIPRPKVTGTCETCGEQFQGPVGKRFCSSYCSKRVRDQSGKYDSSKRREPMRVYQQMNKRKKIPLATKLRIFERDKYICQICGELCDGTAKRDPRMPSIDHIVPWIQTQDDSDTNLRTVHLQCNRTRRWVN